MNPFAMTNLLRPTIASDHRVANHQPTDAGMDYSLSRAAFRLIDAAGKIVSR
ncbi:MAG: hypothetical protein HRU27_00205 [Rhizobiaceae bacterium]|nr:hypothetical protein [Hyphomicrobiales bacterium]NRB28996.1 hypothetical protein [Rhizobiaceae bacterium]